MNLQILFILILIVLFAGDAIAVLYILFAKFRLVRHNSRAKEMARFLIHECESADDRTLRRHLASSVAQKAFLDQYVEMRQDILIGSALDKKIKSAFALCGIDTRYAKRLTSRWKSRRIEAAVYCGHIGTPIALQMLQRTIKKERNLVVGMYTAAALMEIKNADSIPLIVATLPGSPAWYQSRISLFLAEFGFAFHSYVNSIISSSDKAIRLCIISFASEFIQEDLRLYLLHAARDADSEIARAAARALYAQYPIDLDDPAFLEASDMEVRGIAVRALGKNVQPISADRLISLMSNASVAAHAKAGLVDMMTESPRIIDHLLVRFQAESSLPEADQLVQILGRRADLLIMRFHSDNDVTALAILQRMLAVGQINSVMGFLSRNRDIELENEVLHIVKAAAEETPATKQAVCSQLDDRLLKKIGFEHAAAVTQERHRASSGVNKSFLLVLLSGVFLLFPAIFLARHWSSLASMSIRQLLAQFVLDGNYYLVFYSFSTSAIFLGLLLLSSAGALRQKFFSRVKKRAFLFRRNFLPSISIVAPAYNEERTILESINSLLNIRYPDYEVIVVNDGSNDKTLAMLIDNYNLDKIDIFYEERIPTNPVRGIYKNRQLPRLTVIDKANGGKADSLNAGINLSDKEYFCGIDSDSLLEENALLKIVSGTIDEVKETVAVGGNIFPINGCSVSHGVLEKTGTSKNHLANFQFVEYIRAFMAGRIGWSMLNSLLIISGTFGFFSKRRVIECGGYLTGSGKYGRDTVGEDMELVVRLTRHMRENKIPYAINYSYNANCWTEVPEKMNMLLRQRDRWHRGLVEILSFHRRLLFNPKFGMIGMVSIPYFYIFELLGPWIELQGYAMVVLALTLGLINTSLAVLLFLSTVMMGIFISVSSLIIAEQEVSYLSFRGVLKLIVYAVIENFGFRQFLSICRVMGFVNVLRGASGWGTMQRTGFSGRKKT